MPIYEYRCQDCRKKITVFYRSLSSVRHDAAVCDRCGSRRVSRLMSRVRVVRAGAGGNDLGPSGDVDESLLNEMGGLDENDPRSLGRFMRKMAAESGEDLGPEFSEVIGRLEKGEDPERIEQEMGDVFGGEEGGLDADMGGPPPAAPADAAAEKRDKARTARRKTSAGKKPAPKAKQTAKSKKR
jgi:putative FmdB family regulatory protein